MLLTSYETAVRDKHQFLIAFFPQSYQVRGMYIATQFPLENTVNDFWRMIWEKKSNCVVMLANEEEDPVSRASIYC